MIDVQVDGDDEAAPPLASDLIASLVTRALQVGGLEAGLVRVIFSSDEHLRQLQRQFFDQDQYTDVIAFHLNDRDEPLDGEIYISTERALENSGRYGQTHQQELMRLVVHGSLHLIGFDDATDDAQAQMRAEEDRILAWAATSTSA